MSDIIKYDIINPVIQKDKPWYDVKHKLFYIPINTNYSWYVEASAINNNGYKEYFILLGTNKFNINARKCKTDDYGRCKININGEFKNYILNELNYRSNFEFEYIESCEDYDVFKVY